MGLSSTENSDKEPCKEDVPDSRTSVCGHQGRRRGLSSRRVHFYGSRDARIFSERSGAHLGAVSDNGKKGGSGGQRPVSDNVPCDIG